MGLYVSLIGIRSDDPPAPFRPYLIDRLIAYLDETGDLIGYLEWAAPMIEETGAVFYFMRVCHNSPESESISLY
jgi:hypothetical protein